MFWPSAFSAAMMGETVDELTRGNDHENPCKDKLLNEFSVLISNLSFPFRHLTIFVESRPILFIPPVFFVIHLFHLSSLFRDQCSFYFKRTVEQCFLPTIKQHTKRNIVLSQGTNAEADHGLTFEMFLSFFVYSPADRCLIALNDQCALFVCNFR